MLFCVTTKCYLDLNLLFHEKGNIKKDDDRRFLNLISD
jgi:hypothetical protein